MASCRTHSDAPDVTPHSRTTPSVLNVATLRPARRIAMSTMSSCSRAKTLSTEHERTRQMMALPRAPPVISRSLDGNTLTIAIPAWDAFISHTTVPREASQTVGKAFPPQVRRRLSASTSKPHIWPRGPAMPNVRMSLPESASHNVETPSSLRAAKTPRPRNTRSCLTGKLCRSTWTTRPEDVSQTLTVRSKLHVNKRSPSAEKRMPTMSAS
mmetsp:Transcript_33885/g.97488  ORF Transcript_33885/g.97488 Transcript_33885/m.97488 type:complete len:212 (-) Transcript_33885:341-976(-)